jgi:predicted adenine nucleotide alpha hydrolase (AANH) superfamily ATPase
VRQSKSEDFEMEESAKPARAPLDAPENCDRVLLHSCCAPCSGEVMEAMLEAGVGYSVYFYNPNIHPLKEYMLRKEENIRFCEKNGIEFIDADYDPKAWFDRARGMEHEPEKGPRCTMCFDMRFEKAAEYAVNHGYNVFTSCLGISRWKDMDQINASGHRAAARHEGLRYWDYNWRKRGGSERMIEISKREHFYQQEYCGCAYSLRDTNKSRRERGRELVKIGQKFYE